MEFRNLVKLDRITEQNCNSEINKAHALEKRKKKKYYKTQNRNLGVVVVVVLLFYVHGKHLRSCRDGQLT